MAHSLIVGMTESGKSTLGKRLAKKYKLEGMPVLLLDEMGDPDWAHDFRTNNPDEFLKVVFANTECAVFVDESGDMIGRYAGAMSQLATRARQWGHNSHFLTQRAAQLDKTIRDQCRHLFLFCSSLSDSKLLADEYGAPILREGPTLRQGEFLWGRRFQGEPRRLRLW